jgi:hypothetical protein
MPDCYVDTYVDMVAWRRGDRACRRACVMHRETGSVLYTTWPYGSDSSARARADRWIDEELARRDRHRGPLFDGRD